MKCWKCKGRGGSFKKSWKQYKGGTCFACRGTGSLGVKPHYFNEHLGMFIGLTIGIALAVLVMSRIGQ